MWRALAYDFLFHNPARCTQRHVLLLSSRRGKPEDERFECDQFTAYLDQPSLPYLDEAVVDYVADKLGGQLTIKAPKQNSLQWHLMDQLSTNR